MSSANPVRPTGFALIFGWSRVLFTLLVSLAFGMMLGTTWTNGPWSVISRTLALGMIALLVFGVFEQWPRRLPRWLARWPLQVIMVGVAMPVSTALIWAFSTPRGAPAFWLDKDRMEGFSTLAMIGVLIAPWASLAAIVRQREALARHLTHAFDLERSELERQALDARLRLLQAQVAPHFLFNTLANVQALVDAGSPQAPAVLRSLVAYLRAAVPRLDEPTTTLGREVELVRAYLELMHMRMPDRLQYQLEAEPATLALRCPPLTLLTLVENAVRHGIDPSEEGGRIEIAIARRGERCHVRVLDTGVGLRGPGEGLGTGLATLRERLSLAFRTDTRLQLSAGVPRGTLAELEFPALEAAA